MHAQDNLGLALCFQPITLQSIVCVRKYLADRITIRNKASKKKNEWERHQRQRRVKTLADAKQVKNHHNSLQQPDTHSHIYTTWVKGLRKQRKFTM